MKKIATCCLFILAVWSCKNTEEKKSAKQEKKTNETVADPLQNNKPEIANPRGDTLVVSQTALVLYQATHAEIQKWKSENPESFGESVSDNLNYLNEAQTAAEKQHIAIVQTDAKFIRFVNQQGTGKVWTRGVQFEGWGAIAFKENGVPKNIEITDAATGLKNYFK